MEPDASKDQIGRALAGLPVAYATALWLRAKGEPDEVIADAIGLPVQAVPSVIEMAEAKLARTLGVESDPCT